MKKLLFLGLFVLAGMQAWEKLAPRFNAPKPLMDTPYVAVYGRNSCSVTQSMRRQLERQNIPHQYYIVDDQRIADRLHAQMQASGLNTRRYLLPVVDVSGEMMVRPSVETVASLRYSN